MKTPPLLPPAPTEPGRMRVPNRPAPTRLHRTCRKLGLSPMHLAVLSRCRLPDVLMAYHGRTPLLVPLFLQIHRSVLDLRPDYQAVDWLLQNPERSREFVQMKRAETASLPRP